MNPAFSPPDSGHAPNVADTVTRVLDHHPDRPVEFRVRNGVEIVAKRYSAGVPTDVFQAMTSLWESPFGERRLPPGPPRPLAISGRTIEMEALDGPPLGARGDLGDTVVRLGELAGLLADFHCSGVVVDRRRPRRALVRSMVRKLAEVPDTVRPSFARALQALERSPAAVDDLVISHGDFSPRNVIVTTAGLRLIDFDRLQMAAAERDVTYLGAWAWVTQLQDGVRLGPAGPLPTWDIADAFDLAYTARRRHRSGDPDFGLDVGSTRFHRAASLLRIAHGWSALRSEPGLAEIVIGESIRQLDGGREPSWRSSSDRPAVVLRPLSD